MGQKYLLTTLLIISILTAAFFFIEDKYFGEAMMGKFSYDDFEKSENCAECHEEIYNQWKNSMMAQSFTHEWDEIEYFKLALPHALKYEKVAGVKGGCIACHSPMAFMAGDIPPKPVSANTRANEGVTCEVCHNIEKVHGDIPYNFSFQPNPDGTKRSGRAPSGDADHESVQSDLHKSSELCASCHNEKSPWDQWVKSTHVEWKNGPYAAEGVHCQTCHMPVADAPILTDGETRKNAHQHTFPGAHSKSKLRGAVELTLTPSADSVKPGGTLDLQLLLFNAKVGHSIPSGSAEERQLWVRVEAKDSKGNVYHLPVLRKGFDGEEHTITSNELAYQDMGEIMEIAGFKGLERDALPEGDRIFALPYFDEKGRRTVCQWNTAALGTDYRIGPRETKIENYQWKVPENIAPGKVEIEAVLKFKKVVGSVAEFMKLPKDESEAVVINWANYTIAISK